jgi:hypothetical protein
MIHFFMELSFRRPIRDIQEPNTWSKDVLQDRDAEAFHVSSSRELGCISTGLHLIKESAEAPVGSGDTEMEEG